MEQAKIIDLHIYREQPDLPAEHTMASPLPADELSTAILSLIQRLRDHDPLQQAD